MVVAQTPTTSLRLADGRSLDLWADETPGAEILTPLVFHSGTPSSGYGYDVFAAAARERGLRMVGWSRPGYGSSTRQPGRRVRDIVGDTATVLDHVGAEGAYVAGHSGGGPHALACAALMPDRVLGTALISGFAPFEAEGLDFLDGMGPENHEEFAAALAGEGGHDRMVPFAHGQWLAAHLGNPCLHLHEEHGHMSLAVAGLPAILDSLVANT